MNPGYAADEKHWCLTNANLKAFGQKEQLAPCGAEPPTMSDGTGASNSGPCGSPQGPGGC